ncbi:MAG: T9SS type A sorting domain-containing protein [Flavobacteriales bacterium]|nr:T9SS type A sorting domain-containing protein [Flavobacteriales bacterium]
MKALFILLCSSPAIFFAQYEIPNGNFETWDYYNTWSLEPESWDTPNGQLVVAVVPDSNAYEGELAMRVNVLPGFEGGVSQEASALVMIEDDLPASLQFAVKANVPDGNEQDRVEVIVEYRNQDAVVYTQLWQSFASIEDWQVENLELDLVEIPADEIRIIVKAGYTSGFSGGSWDTWIAVDAMQFQIPDNVKGVFIDAQVIFPNPVESVLYLIGEALCDFILINDLFGRAVMKESFSKAIDVSSLSPGLYIIDVGTSRQKFMKQ